MSQHNSGYQRLARDCYPTPSWVTQVIVPHVHAHAVWEPASGPGRMATILRMAGKLVVESDIDRGQDFLTAVALPVDCSAIVTNPPYTHARKFVERALELTAPIGGMVAMLLRTDFDEAKSRRHLFGRSRVFARKIVLTQRIRWFEGSKGSPSENHAWFIWDHANGGAPVITYH